MIDAREQRREWTETIKPETAERLVFLDESHPALLESGSGTVYLTCSLEISLLRSRDFGESQMKFVSSSTKRLPKPPPISCAAGGWGRSAFLDIYQISTIQTFLHRNRSFLLISTCFYNEKPPVRGVTRRWPEGSVEKPRKFWAKRRIFGTFAQTYGVYQMSEAGRVQPKTGPSQAEKN